MSPLSIVVICESGVLLVLALFVVALLRSHAEILRRLAGLEGAPADAAMASGATAGRASAAAGPASVAAGPQTAPADLVGQTPGGDAVKLALGGGSPRTLLAFLSSGCGGCGPLWAGLQDGVRTPPGTRLVVVTKGPDRESPSRIAALSPASSEVLMSTPAWEEFAIPSTPHFVLVDGAEGRIVGRGGAGSWQQILTFVHDADQDSRPGSPGSSVRLGSAARPGSPTPASSSAPAGSSARAARAEEALARAGVTAGHPSLYPSRTPEPDQP